MRPTYLMQTEDGTFFVLSREPNEEERAMCDAGVLVIIDTSNMTEYFDGEWHSIQEWSYE